MKASRLLRYARRSAGFTQRELAERAGVPQSTVARIEGDQLQPRWDTLNRLVDATGRGIELTDAGAGIDRSQMRRLLQLTPHERLLTAMADADGLDRFVRAAVRKGSRR